MVDVIRCFRKITRMFVLSFLWIWLDVHLRLMQGERVGLELKIDCCIIIFYRRKKWFFFLLLAGVLQDPGTIFICVVVSSSFVRLQSVKLIFSFPFFLNKETLCQIKCYKQKDKHWVNSDFWKNIFYRLSPALRVNLLFMGV